MAVNEVQAPRQCTQWLQCLYVEGMYEEIVAVKYALSHTTHLKKEDAHM